MPKWKKTNKMKKINFLKVIIPFLVMTISLTKNSPAAKSTKSNSKLNTAKAGNGSSISSLKPTSCSLNKKSKSSTTFQ